MSEPIEIPTTMEEVTAVWLTNALRTSRTIHTATVTDIRLTALGEIMGVMGVLVRIHLAYDQLEESAPTTLIAKLSSPDAEFRAIIAKYRMYEREVRFYQEVANHIKMRTPHCYYSAINETGEHCVLLLEDMAPAQVGDQVLGCSVAEAELALLDLAKLHAAYWNSPLLEELSWAPNAVDPGQMNLETFSQQLRPTFLEKWGQQLSDVIRDVSAGYGNMIPAIAHQMSQCPKTLLHGDYRLDNLFFEHSVRGVPFAVADWQTTKIGPGTCDVAYFLTMSLETEIRRRAEMNLLHLYHHTLLENGVRTYPFERCLADYRLSLFYPLNITIEAGAYVDFSTDRVVRLMNGILERVTAVLQDHNIEGLLADLAGDLYA